MKIRINNEIVIFTEDTRIQIAKKIQNDEIDLYGKNGLINWGQVWLVQEENEN